MIHAQPTTDYLWHVRPATADEWPTALGVLLADRPEDDRRMIIDHLETMAVRGRIPRDALWIAVIITDFGPAIGGVILAEPIPGRVAGLWSPVVVDENRTDIEDLLLSGALDYLDGLGVRATQSMFTIDGDRRAQPLLRHGFRSITCIWHMRYLTDLAATPSLNESLVSFRPAQDVEPALLDEVLVRTFFESHDCPEWNDCRSPEDIVTSQRHGAPDLSLWWLAWREGRPVGLLSLHRPGPEGIFELSYLGVVPECRRFGYGRALLTFARHHTHTQKAKVLTLMVDQRDIAAYDLYRSQGFAVHEVQELYLRLRPQN